MQKKKKTDTVVQAAAFHEMHADELEQLRPRELIRLPDHRARVAATGQLAASQAITFVFFLAYAIHLIHLTVIARIHYLTISRSSS